MPDCFKTLFCGLGLQNIIFVCRKVGRLDRFNYEQRKSRLAYRGLARLLLQKLPQAKIRLAIRPTESITALIRSVSQACIVRVELTILYAAKLLLPEADG